MSKQKARSFIHSTDHTLYMHAHIFTLFILCTTGGYKTSTPILIYINKTNIQTVLYTTIHKNIDKIFLQKSIIVNSFQKTAAAIVTATILIVFTPGTPHETHQAHLTIHTRHT